MGQDNDSSTPEAQVVSIQTAGRGKTPTTHLPGLVWPWDYRGQADTSVASVQDSYKWQALVAHRKVWPPLEHAAGFHFTGIHFR